MMDQDFNKIYVALVDKKGYGKTMLSRYTVKYGSARVKTKNDDFYLLCLIRDALKTKISASSSRISGRTR